MNNKDDLSLMMGVRIVYRNEKLEPTYIREYSLGEYTETMRLDLLRLITDVEDLIYDAYGGKAKDEWGDRVWVSFCKIKHKLLDKAGDISRLPENIFMNTKKEECSDGKDSLGQTAGHCERDDTYSSCCG
jgi:hypothetical protein